VYSKEMTPKLIKIKDASLSENEETKELSNSFTFDIGNTKFDTGWGGLGGITNL
jgi:hypothetical protein